MSTQNFMRGEVAAAIQRGVRQFVVLGSERSLEAPALNVFYLPPESETLERALEKSEFDRLKASLFVWLGDARYRTMEAVIASFGFIASLPKGSGVVFDYVVERTSFGSRTSTALDALASRLPIAGSMKYFIQPQAVTAMLRGMGFQQIVETEGVPVSGGRLVSATL